MEEEQYTNYQNTTKNDSEPKRRRFKLKPTWFDAIIFGVSMTLALSFLGIKIYESKRTSELYPIAEVYYCNDLVYSKYLNKINSDYEVTFSKSDYPKLVGDIVVSFSSTKGVAITKTSCTSKECEHVGYINKVGSSIVCLPSSFYIAIAGSSLDDGVIGSVLYE